MRHHALIQPTHLRQLDLHQPTRGQNPRHISAASGFVLTPRFMYVVADDENHLGVFPATDNAPGELVRILDGELPREKVERKALKPDFESLAHLPSLRGIEGGALLALGSGSTPKRRASVMLPLDAGFAVQGPARPVDSRALFSALADRVPEVNIEGAFCCGRDFMLLQRGNAGSGGNAVVRIPLTPLLEQLWTGLVVQPEAVDVHACELGSLAGIPLSFTDGAGLPDGSFVFCAVAEATTNAYDDGECKGSAIGVVDASGQLLFIAPLAGSWKVEGIAVRVEGRSVFVKMVTDADDAGVAGQVIAATLEGYPFNR